MTEAEGKKFEALEKQVENGKKALRQIIEIAGHTGGDLPPTDPDEDA